MLLAWGIQELLAPTPWRSGHARADCGAYWNPNWVKTIKAKDIDSKIVWRDTFPVERIDAARLAEVMNRGVGMKPVLTQGRIVAEQAEIALMDLDHQGVLAAADRAVTRRELGETGVDLEANGAAMTAACVSLARWTGHFFGR